MATLKDQALEEIAKLPEDVQDVVWMMAIEHSIVLRLEAKGEIIRLEPDVAKVFDSSEAVNKVLRALMEAMPKKAS